MWIYFAQNFSQRLKLRIVFHEIVHLICPNEKTGKKSRFLLELNEMPNEDSLLLIGFPRRFFDFLHKKLSLFEMMLFNHSAKI
ncbi:hypothetical protein LRP_1489 [Ligilactobacillus ruminis]|nr:hypothetical protein LRP_1489 [Ligilactobacillus ruminis]